MLFEEHVKYSPINSTHYAKLYPQNGERIVTIDSVIIKVVVLVLVLVLETMVLVLAQVAPFARASSSQFVSKIVQTNIFYGRACLDDSLC